MIPIHLLTWLAHAKANRQNGKRPSDSLNYARFWILMSFTVTSVLGCTPGIEQALATPAQKMPGTPGRSPTAVENRAPIDSPTPTEALPAQAGANQADVLSVQVSGETGAYQFSVEISSPDLGCQQYADWWEVVDDGGALLYRRILAHSHVNEQPFTRSGGPAPIHASTIVWVRAHMHPGGYGGAVMKGSVKSGFQPAEFDPDFAPGLADIPPLPDGCGF